MNMEIHDMALEARIRKQIQATGASSAEEALLPFSIRRKNRIAGCWKTRKPLRRRSGAASISSIEARVFRKINWMPTLPS